MTTSSAGKGQLDPRRGACLEIDLGAIAENYRILQRRFTGSECAVAVKADAYGLGVAHVGPALEKAGARTFFVAFVGEALALRVLLPSARIAVLNGFPPDAADDFVHHGLIPVLNHLGDVEAWSGIAAREGRPLPSFIQFDTGMSRLGLEPSEQGILASEPGRLDGIDVVGWMTHLACADDPDHPLNGQQRERLKTAAEGLPPAPLSLCNSAGIFLGQDFHFDIGRPGSALYGISPVSEGDNPMRQPVRLTSPILQVRTIPKGAIVGYGATYAAARPSRIATIPVGYADGMLRSLSNRGTMWLGGHAVPMAGRVSMDLITLDVTDVPESLAQPGQMVEVIGPHMTPDAIAEQAGTIGYEVLTALGRRYDRHYHGPTA